VLFGKNARELRHPFLAPVFFVAGEKDDVLARARTALSLVGDPLWFGGKHGECRNEKSGEYWESFHGGDG
jgi:hypothetical protein